MNTAQKLRKIIQEEVKRAIKESRIQFQGQTAMDLEKAIRGKQHPLIFANGNFYSVYGRIQSDPKDPKYVYLMDDDGEEHEINVRDIEFIEAH